MVLILGSGMTKHHLTSYRDSWSPRNTRDKPSNQHFISNCTLGFWAVNFLFYLFKAKREMLELLIGLGLTNQTLIFSMP